MCLKDRTTVPVAEADCMWRTLVRESSERQAKARLQRAVEAI